MNSYENPSPMLGTNYSQWSLGRGRGSFAEFSSIRNGLKGLAYQGSTDSNLIRSTSQPDDISTFGEGSGDNTSPSTAYSGYSSPAASAASQAFAHVDMESSRGPSAATVWWEQNLRSNKGQYHNEWAMNNEDMAKIQHEHQHERYDVWNSGRSSMNHWTSESIAPSTISPKALILNVSPAAPPSSTSNKCAVPELSESDSVASLQDSVMSRPEALVVIEQQPIRRPRQALPDSVPASYRIVPVLPSNDVASSKSPKRRHVKVTGVGNHSHRNRSPSPIITAPVVHSSSRRSATAPQKSSRPKKIEPMPGTPATQPWNNNSQTTAMTQAMHHRDAKDDFLVRSKLAGISYKDIRRQGKFIEAESTLRGRFRTLTKHKTARVRKPEWDDNDVSLAPRRHECAF